MKRSPQSLKLLRRMNRMPSPRKEARLPEAPSVSGQLAAEHLGTLGIEVWRLGKRLAGIDAPRLHDSHERLVRAFENLGGRIEDRTGESFFDGMRAEILDQPDDSPASARLVVADTVRPAILVDDVCVIESQIILAIADSEES